jgi:hypothetical protein
LNSLSWSDDIDNIFFAQYSTGFILPTTSFAFVNHSWNDCIGLCHASVILIAVCHILPSVHLVHRSCATVSSLVTHAGINLFIHRSEAVHAISDTCDAFVEKFVAHTSFHHLPARFAHHCIKVSTSLANHTGS